jgi:hypothetical protein
MCHIALCDNPDHTVGGCRPPPTEAEPYLSMEPFCGTNVARGLTEILAPLGERGLRHQQLPGIEPGPPVCLLETFQTSHMITLTESWLRYSYYEPHNLQ